MKEITQYTDIGALPEGTYKVTRVEDNRLLERMHFGRICQICGDSFDIAGANDIKCLCPDCCKVLKIIINKEKQNAYNKFYDE